MAPFWDPILAKIQKLDKITSVIKVWLYLIARNWDTFSLWRFWVIEIRIADWRGHNHLPNWPYLIGSEHWLKIFNVKKCLRICIISGHKPDRFLKSAIEWVFQKFISRSGFGQNWIGTHKISIDEFSRNRAGPFNTGHFSFWLIPDAAGDKSLPVWLSN